MLCVLISELVILQVFNTELFYSLAWDFRNFLPIGFVFRYKYWGLSIKV